MLKEIFCACRLQEIAIINTYFLLARLLENSKHVLHSFHETTARKMNSSLPLMSNISTNSVNNSGSDKTLCYNKRKEYALKRCYTTTLPQGLGIRLLLGSESTTLGVNPQELLRRQK